jgi:cytochrome c556
MKRFAIPLCAVLAFATAAFAHSGVKDPQVMARMVLMTDVADDIKALVALTKSDFDPQIAALHGSRLAAHADQIAPLFEQPATDPKSEARPEIWQDWAGFLADAEDMRIAAEAVAASEKEDAFTQAFARLGQSCTACHKDYRISKD